MDKYGTFLIGLILIIIASLAGACAVGFAPSIEAKNVGIGVGFTITGGLVGSALCTGSIVKILDD